MSSLRCLFDGANFVNEVVFGGDDITIADLEPRTLGSALRSHLGEEQQQTRLADQRITQLQDELGEMEALIDALQDVRQELIARSSGPTGFTGVWTGRETG